MDEHHLNAIEEVDGALYVSGFGKRESEQWPSAKHGFIYNIDRNEYVMRDVYHPHSLLEDSNVIWTSESAMGRLVSDKGDKIDLPTGYARGKAAGVEHLYAGSSKRRAVSHSTATVNPQRLSEYKGVCCVYEVTRESNEARVLIDFSEVRNEIYEMLLF